jgi:hypothetical protein
MAALGPASVPIHDYREVVREILRVEFGKELGLLAGARPKEFGCFHR